MDRQSVSRIEQIVSASNVGQLIAHHGKISDAKLHAVLAECAQISELAEMYPHERKALDVLIAQLPKLPGKRRHYIEKDSDIYQRVCRFMFHGEKHTANTNRYAICIREAALRGITSDTLRSELIKGGINKFFLLRRSNQARITTKCIRLDRQIEHLKKERIQLTLERNAENIYTVVALLTGVE